MNGQQPVRLLDGDTMTVTAAPCGVPGLVIHRVVLIGAELGDGLTITHVRSGLALGYFPPEVDPEAVLACANALGALADWTLPAYKLRLSLNADDVWAAVHRWSGSSTGCKASDFTDLPGGAA